jgi:small GTP-binding protein
MFIVYDITNPESFKNINEWLKEIDEFADKSVVKLLVGNKCDIEEYREISFEKGREFGVANGMNFIEISAKTFYNLDEAFCELTRDIILRYDGINEIVKKIDLLEPNTATNYGM